MQKRRNSSALALELRLFCIMPLISSVAHLDPCGCRMICVDLFWVLIFTSIIFSLTADCATTVLIGSSACSWLVRNWRRIGVVLTLWRGTARQKNAAQHAALANSCMNNATATNAVASASATLSTAASPISGARVATSQARDSWCRFYPRFRQKYCNCDNCIHISTYLCDIDLVEFCMALRVIVFNSFIVIALYHETRIGTKCWMK